MASAQRVWWPPVSEPAEDSDDTPRPRRRSRRALVAGGVAVGLALVSGGALAHRSRSAARRAQASALASQAYERLREGRIGSALKLATDARKLDPGGRDPAYAWMHATGLALLEDAGGAKEAVGFMNEARRLGAAGTDLAFCLVVGAVAVRNDKLARRTLAQHEGQGIVEDAFYAFARGAALDLCCDGAAAEAYESSLSLWADAVLPRLRLARAHLLRGKTTDAKEAVAPLPRDAIGRLVIEAAAARLETRRVAPAPPFGSAAIAEAPRALRPIGLALLVQADDPNAALDAAMDDVDSPLVAVLSGKLAMIGGDLVSAEAAARAAQRMRPESPDVAAFGVQLALARGDLDRARAIAEESGDAATTAIVAAIDAYERKAPEKIREAVEAAMDAGVSPWRLANEARGTLGDGPPPVVAVVPKGAPLPPLWAALEEGEPWADVVLFDAAFAAGDTRTCQAVVDRWKEPSKPRDARRALLTGKPPSIR